ITVQMPRGTRLQETHELIAQLEELVLEIPEVSSILSQAGSAGQAGGASASDEGMILVQLVPFAERNRSTQDVIEEVRRITSGIGLATIEVRPMSTMGVGIG